MPFKDPEKYRAMAGIYCRRWLEKSPKNRETYNAAARASYHRRKERLNSERRAKHAANRDELNAIRRAKRALKTQDAREKRLQEAPLKKAQAQQARILWLSQWHRTYRAANPQQFRAYGHARRARENGHPYTLTPEQESFCRAHFHYTCAVCGHEEGFQWRIVLDHWIPLKSPDCPGTVATNMIPLCHGVGGCNNSKKDKDPETWLIARVGKRKAATILKRIRAYFALVAPKEQDA